ncbi:MAG: hypothetical protein J6Z50_01800, partial [Fibrobacterales bacterium]|nr:hypothetical protein [Fibrobacterales bacterium]
MAEKKVKDYAPEVGVTPVELAKILASMKVEGVRGPMSTLDESAWNSIKAEVLEKAEPFKKKAAAKKPAAAKKTASKKEAGDEKSGDEKPRMKIVRKKKSEPEAPAPEPGTKAEEAPAETKPAPEAKAEPAPAPAEKPAEAKPEPEPAAKIEPAAKPEPAPAPAAEKPAEAKPAPAPIILTPEQIEAERRKAEAAAAAQHVDLKVKVEKPSEEFAARIARYAAQRNAGRPSGDRGPRR